MKLEEWMKAQELGRWGDYEGCGYQVLEWQPIDTAPKDGKEFLTINMRCMGVMSLIRWDKVHHRWLNKGNVENLQATHWMESPERPNKTLANSDQGVDKAWTK